MSKRVSRFTLIVATAAGLAFSTGTAAANPSESVIERRADNAPGGATTQIDGTASRPAGAGQGRKVG